MTKPADISQLKTTTVKTTTATLLRPRALKNNNDVLEVHLPTLMSSFISQNDGFLNSMRSPIMLTGDLPTIGNSQFVEEIIPKRSGNQLCLGSTYFVFLMACIVYFLRIFNSHLLVQLGHLIRTLMEQIRAGKSSQFDNQMQLSRFIPPLISNQELIQLLRAYLASRTLSSTTASSTTQSTKQNLDHELINLLRLQISSTESTPATEKPKETSGNQQNSKLTEDISRELLNLIRIQISTTRSTTTVRTTSTTAKAMSSNLNRDLIDLLRHFVTTSASKPTSTATIATTARSIPVTTASTTTTTTLTTTSTAARTSTVQLTSTTTTSPKTSTFAKTSINLIPG